MIDEALGELGEADREAIVLRYFESYEFALVGSALGVSENAARMRVDRALDKLRTVLQNRGVATTGAALAGALAESSATAVLGATGRADHGRGSGANGRHVGRFRPVNSKNNCHEKNFPGRPRRARLFGSDRVGRSQLARFQSTDGHGLPGHSDASRAGSTWRTGVIQPPSRAIPTSPRKSRSVMTNRRGRGRPRTRPKPGRAG